MNALDYGVIAIYFAGLLGFGFLLRNQSDEGDFFLGGRTLGWFPLSLSIMATQLSAISFISAPAFVGLREGGGLRWLTYELAVPLAMLLIMFVIAPALYRSGVVSIYQYLDDKFGRSTRMLISVLFQIVRSFSTGIMVYAIGIILDAVLGIPFWQSLILIGFITIVYSTSGGMKAVVYGDAIQMVLIFGGLALVTYYALTDIGGFGAFLDGVSPDRMKAVDVGALGFSGDQFGLVPMIFGGIILYTSYYGCDQSQTQRILSSRNLGDVRRLLLANGLLRFPLVLLYCTAGLIIGVAVMSSPELLAEIPSDKPDYMMPVYIIDRLPHGLIGLLVVAILAAAMSSLSSVINSLAAVTLEDMSALGIKPSSDRSSVTWARVVSVFWGAVILVLSAFAGSIAPTVIEAINKVGSALYGPVLGVFLIGILFKRISTIGVNVGLVIGLAVNLYLWKFEPQVFWMWYNVFGLLITIAIGWSVSRLTGRPNVVADLGEESDDASGGQKTWLYSVVLIGFFVAILAFSISVEDIVAGILP